MVKETIKEKLHLYFRVFLKKISIATITRREEKTGEWFISVNCTVNWNICIPGLAVCSEHIAEY